MNLEQLTKHQIVLLALLVSIVTAIVTGIVTVALIGQAPQGVTKVVNQVVEHTVDTIVPTPTGPAVTTQNTVVVKEDDLAAQSIAAVQKSIIRVTARGGQDLLARGVIIEKDGTAVTDSAALAESGATNFDAILEDGERVPLTVRGGLATTSPIAVLSVAVGTSTGFAPATLTDSTKLQLGQSVIRIGGTGQDIVGEGVVAVLPAKGGNEVETSVSSATPGSVILTLFGEVIGIATAQSLSDGAGFYTLIAQPATAATSTQTGN